MFGHPVLKPNRRRFPKHFEMLKLFIVEKKDKVPRMKKNLSS